MTVDDPRFLGDAGVAAAERAAELRDLNARLQAGGRVDAADVDRAQNRASVAHVRARRAHLAAAEQHRHAAGAAALQKARDE
ncbi:hypothetical protein AU193_01975 [Mycobacterium sp. GA-1285]|uniref:hypothetical protein n=1 Tax=Mycobacterium sp. GA-1285 TaxID=1772282 RepID=UPI000746C9F9|nr:hypothetical protein [Mycobacterium sp. GA-1285]KUI11908.1 hypothetical protein AU193_01975 [Mycobacterium sp. GA-1285]